MKNMNYARKYHYMLKYFVLAFPLLYFFVLYLCNIGFSNDKHIITNFGVLKSAFTYWQSFVTYGINNFYNVVINSVFNVSLGSIWENNYIVQYLLLTYPLYVMWVYVFDLLLDVFCLLPKLAHKLMDKLSGGENY